MSTGEARADETVGTEEGTIMSNRNVREQGYRAARRRRQSERIELVQAVEATTGTCIHRER